MFVSHGGQPHTMTRRSCEKLLRNGHLRLVDSSEVVNKALSEMKDRKKRRRTAAAALSLFLVLALVSAFILDRLFPFPVDRLEPAPSTRVLDRNGKSLRYFLALDGMWRFPVTLDEVSPDLVTALIHSEDRHFRHHPGVNPLAVIRAMWSNLRHGRVVSGASTIPMQVARMADPHPRTFGTKLVEALRALQLNAHYSKEQILTWYVNLAPRVK